MLAQCSCPVCPHSSWYIWKVSLQWKQGYMTYCAFVADFEYFWPTCNVGQFSSQGKCRQDKNQYHKSSSLSLKSLWQCLDPVLWPQESLWLDVFWYQMPMSLAPRRNFYILITTPSDAGRLPRLFKARGLVGCCDNTPLLNSQHPNLGSGPTPPE